MQLTSLPFDAHRIETTVGFEYCAALSTLGTLGTLGTLVLCDNALQHTLLRPRNGRARVCMDCGIGFALRTAGVLSLARVSKFATCCAALQHVVLRCSRVCCVATGRAVLQQVVLCRSRCPK